VMSHMQSIGMGVVSTWRRREIKTTKVTFNSAKLFSAILYVVRIGKLQRRFGTVVSKNVPAGTLFGVLIT
jgi:hypothetical protein